MGRCEACHALIRVDVRPALQDRNSVALPLATLDGQSASLRTLRVLKRFEFDPALTRSGVIARDKSVNGALLFVRGAPHKVVGLVKGGALPSDFDQVHHVLHAFGPDYSAHLEHIWATLLQHSARLHAVTTAMVMAHEQRDGPLSQQQLYECSHACACSLKQPST